jgi:hypothetical protein
MDIRKQFVPEKTVNGVLAALLTVGFAHALPAQAEIKIMDDDALAAVTGKAGLTLEIDLKLNISEIAYRDQGFLAIEDFAWGGADRTGKTGVTGSFNNWKMVVDVTDGVESLAYGFSELDQLHGKVSAPGAGWDAAIGNNDEPRVHSDGSLVLHNTSAILFDGTRYDSDSDSDVPVSAGSSIAGTMDDWRNSAPFGIKIGAIKLHDSGYAVGSKTGDGTVLMSDFNAEVLTGPLDIVIENGGSGTAGAPGGRMTFSDYFEISDMSLTLDFLGISLSGVRLHNRRGDTTGLNMNKGADGIADSVDDVATESFGFAHAKWYLAAAPDLSDGLQIAGAIKGDLDIERITLGNNGLSIGAIYLTDMTIRSSMNIRGH